MKESQIVCEFIEDVMKLVNQIRLMGDSFTDVKVVEKIMMSLPERFDTRVASLELVKDISELTISDLDNALAADEERKAANRDERVDHVLSAHMKGKAHVDSSFGKNPNYIKEKDKASIPTGSFHNRKERVCKNEADAIDKKPQVAKQVEKAKVAEEVLFMATTNSSSTDENQCLLDSACSNHMTSKVELFSEIDTNYCSSVKIGNGYIFQSTGKGTISIQTALGT
ncbi:PREDICTED: uncharacterized protein LOC108662806 [Theobroma cacao]|uniref:Uncharacterized protein LOC108662806 n=1 Tax=Theobroma cacao TaxID=3641 RepID=A0AB32WM73_THECC|nr:PREDICTED: uncharacterized protein LOC108662806 [Theobroma cacao]